MATSFKTFNDKDSVVTRNLLHEALPITGTIGSGTYADNNIKNFSHGMFQSVYDYPFLSSSANHIFDLTCGYSSVSLLSASNSSQNAKKINIYNQMAQVLAGFNENGAVRQFDEDGDLSGGSKINNAYFFNMSRLLTKDEIKKGSFTLTMGLGEGYPLPAATGTVGITDLNGINSYKVNSPAGEYGILYATGSLIKDGVTERVSGGDYVKAGLLYYQAGVAVLTASLFDDYLDTPVQFNAAGNTVLHELSGAVISNNCNSIRHRINNLSFNNTVELNSTIYFCRVNNTDFNYTSNPTYLSSSKIVVKNNAQDLPVTYVTTVGLYSGDNELLAVAKLSEPLKNDPTTEFNIRVRLDY